MLPARFPVRITMRLVSVPGLALRTALVVPSLVACALALMLLLGVAEIARAELSCPPACVTCNANPKCVWHNNFCFCTIDPDKNVLSDLDVPDPVLT